MIQKSAVVQDKLAWKYRAARVLLVNLTFPLSFKQLDDGLTQHIYKLFYNDNSRYKVT